MITNATFVSIWDNETEVRTNCKWDDKKWVAFDIDSADVQGIDILTREYVELPDGTEIDVDSQYETDDGVPGARTYRVRIQFIKVYDFDLEAFSEEDAGERIFEFQTTEIERDGILVNVETDHAEVQGRLSSGDEVSP